MNETEKIEVLLDSYFENKNIAIIDMFPYTVSENNTMFGDVEGYLLENAFKNFTQKLFTIFIKFICYHEYDEIIIETFSNGKFIYKEHKRNNLSIKQINKIFINDLPKKKIYKLHVYFKQLDALLSIEKESVSAYMFGLDKEDEAYKLLEKLTYSEGLFIR